jgi:hypothetical protein
MGEPQDVIKSMADIVSVFGGMPGVDAERLADSGAEKVRKTLSEGLAEVSEDLSQKEVYDEMKALEDTALEDGSIDTDGIPEGQVRMRCQVTLVERLMEEKQ